VKVDYGIDAPAVIRNLALIGAICILAAVLASRFINVSAFLWPRLTVLITGILCLLEAGLMLLYSTWGKFRHRDKMLAMVSWSGNERVLDVGTGRGLLLIGAAKHLSSGTAVGLDVWSQRDLSGNAMSATERNLQLEGVADRCTLVTENAQKLSFADAGFDVVLSNLCLHNIPAREERDRACAEIVRVLKPNGHVVISDYKNSRQYAHAFRKLGLTIERTSWDPLTFPPLRTLTAVKGDGA